MGINSKILSFFVGIFVFSIIGFLLTWQYQFSRLQSVQQQRLKEIQSSFSQTIAMQSKGLDTFVFETSYWDEMVSFVSTRNWRWAENTLIASTEEHHYDYVIVYDTKKSIVLYHQHDDEQGSIKQVLPRSTLKMKEPYFSHYFLLNGNDLVEIFSAPIQPSNDSKRSTLPNGYFLVGKIWDKALIEQFSHNTNLKIELLAGKKAASDESSFLYPLKSYDGEIVANLKVSNHSTVVDTLNDVFSMQLLVLLLFGLIVIGLAYAVIYRYIIKPLKTISTIIESRESIETEDDTSSKDEFSDIAHSLKVLLKDQKNLEQEKEKFEAELHQLSTPEQTLTVSDQQDPVLDINEFNDIVGSKKLADKFLRKFFDELSGKYALLPVQIANHEESAAADLHTLKGTSANIRAYRLHFACRVIDEKYHSNGYILSGEIDALQAAIDEVIDRLKSLGYTQIEAGGMDISALHRLYDEIRDTLSSLNTVLPEKQRLLIANLQEIVDPNALEEWDWAMCENEYDKALEMMINWKIFKERT